MSCTERQHLRYGQGLSQALSIGNACDNISGAGGMNYLKEWEGTIFKAKIELLSWVENFTIHWASGRILRVFLPSVVRKINTRVNVALTPTNLKNKNWVDKTDSK